MATGSFTLAPDNVDLQAASGTKATIAVRSKSGKAGLSVAFYPDEASKLTVVGGKATLEVKQGLNNLSVTATPVAPWEDWWVVEVLNGVDSPALAHGSPFQGGQFNLNIAILGL